MFQFTQLLRPENIRQGVHCSSKKRVLEAIGRLFAEQLNYQELDEIQCFESLFSREKLGNTGIGAGVALPRAKLGCIDQPIAAFFQMEHPLDYAAADNRDVDLILAILVPEQVCTSYPQVMAEIAERLSDKALCKQLRAAKSAEEIWQVFEYADACAHANAEQIAECEENRP